MIGLKGQTQLYSCTVFQTAWTHCSAVGIVCRPLKLLGASTQPQCKLVVIARTWNLTDRGKFDLYKYILVWANVIGLGGVIAC